jgi:DNA polymerase delta subunit 1
MMSHNLCYTTFVQDPSTCSASFLQEQCEKTPTGHYFVKSSTKPGLLPRILSEILEARAQAKRMMKEEKDPFRKALFNGRQLALKVNANSVYGFTGVSVGGKLPCIPISSSVTGYGREMLEITKKLIEEKYTIQNGYTHDASVIYGDTDSVFVKFGPTDLKTCMEYGKEAAPWVTKHFPKPISLEMEKCYWPYLLQSKKRYAGVYWTRLDKYDKIDYKGMEVARRDSCKLVTKLIEDCLTVLFLERNVEKTKQLVKSAVRDLYLNKVDLSLLLMRKGMNMSAEDYKANAPHVALAKRMYKRDPTTAPRMGDAVWFVYITNTNKQTTKVGEIIEDPLYVAQHKIPISAQQYVEKLKKPVSGLLGLAMSETEVAKLWTGSHTMTRKLAPAKRHGSNYGLYKYLKHVTDLWCLKCRAQLQPTETKGLCKMCEPSRESLLATYSQERDTLAEKSRTFHKTCVDCQDGTPYHEIDCHRIDCPIFFTRNTTDSQHEVCCSNIKQLTW